VVTPDGNYVIAAFHNTLKAPLWGQAVLIKMDTLGDTLWTREYGTTGRHDQPRSLVQTRDSGFLLVGYRVGPFIGDDYDLMLIKTDSVGNEEWTKYYGIPWDAWGDGVCRSVEGGYLVSGFREQNGGLARGWLLKIDEDGNMQWEDFYDLVEDNSDRCGLWRKLVQLPDSSYVAIGWGGGRGRIIKTDVSGELIWQRGYVHQASQNGANHGHYFYGMDTTSDGGFIVCGSTKWENQTQDGWLVKLDEWGCDTPGCHLPDTNTAAPLAPYPPKGELRVYPNPSNGSFTVELPGQQQWNLQLFDVSGRLAAEESVFGEQAVIQEHRTGLYFLRATAEDGTTGTAKVVVE
jgi:hypothetical protein